MNDAEVLIIGAGPAGLALCQILTANGVSCIVFERDSAINVRGQGWAVALRESVERLVTMLPESLGDINTTSVNSATGTIDTGAVINGSTNQKLAEIGGYSADQRDHPDYMLRVRREKLREYMIHGVRIEWSKQFSSYEQDESGVTAIFKDGSRYRGSILVGADGASSHVRSQLLDHQHTEPATFLPVVGMFKFSSKEELDEFQNIATSVFIACLDDLRFMVGLLDSASDRTSGHAYYAVCYKVPAPEKEVEWMHTASQEELFNKALDKTTGLSSSLTKYIHKAGAEGVLVPPLLFREFMPPMSLPPGRVTLIGDALHTMMPFRGAGANTALLDACDLGERIVNFKKQTDSTNVANLLHEFSEMACPRGRNVVAATHHAGEDMHMVFGIEKILARKLAEMAGSGVAR